MAEITKEEFSKIYKEKIEPMLGVFEAGRIEVQKKSKPFIICGFICIVIMIFILVVFAENLKLSALLFIFPAIISFCIASKMTSNFSMKLKKEVLSKVLAIYGNIYFSGKKNLITLSDIKNMGLFRRAQNKKDDDIVIGVHKNLNFAIIETDLTHTEGSGKNRKTVTDFKGIILKIQMHKSFSGKTVVGVKGHVNKPGGAFEKVELESIDFMKNREIYSTDQIEARYILTTSFMERIAALGKAFLSDRTGIATENLPSIDVPILGNLNSLPGVNIPILGELNTFLSPTISAAFIEGYAYLFVPTVENFFEIPIDKTLYDELAYYRIYTELGSIMGIIEHLHLDKNTGL